MGPITDEFRAKTEELYNPIDDLTPEDVENIALGHIEDVISYSNLQDEITVVDCILSGSRCRGMEKEGSDIDIVVECESDWNESALWDLFNEDEPEIAGIPVDINPILAYKTGTLEEYLPRVEDYLYNG